MPVTGDRSIKDRDNAAFANLHPRPNGDMILQPDDILEGIGDLLRYDDAGNPVGWILGRPETPIARNVYIGLSPDRCVKQTHRGVAYDRPSFVASQALLEEGPLAPTQDTPLLAKIPKPDAATLDTMPASQTGYPASTAQSPYWYGWARVSNGKLALPSPYVSFRLNHGQSARVPLPERGQSSANASGRTTGTATVIGKDEWALLLSEPGTSRPDGPGPMYVQRIVDLNRYFLDYYELTGPFRRDQPASGRNETVLPSPSRGRAYLRSRSVASRVAQYLVRWTWTDQNGESLPGGMALVTVPKDSSYSYTPSEDEGGEEVIAGRGYVRIERPPNPPPGATGWRPYVWLSPSSGSAEDLAAGMYRVVDKFNGEGGEQPFPLSRSHVDTAGWFGNEQPYGLDDRVVLESAQQPTANTTGVETPTERPAPPTAFGASRLAPDLYYVRITDELENGAESVASDAVGIDLGADDVLRVIFPQPDTIFPNPTFAETTPDGLPLDFDTVTTGGDAKVIGSEFVLWTDGPQTGTTPSTTTNRRPVDPAVTGFVEADFTLEDPASGTRSGSVQVVLREYTATGIPTDTVIFTATAPGDYDVEREIAATGTSGALLSWRADTVEAELLSRFVGASPANLRQRIRAIKLRPHRRNLRRNLRDVLRERRGGGGGSRKRRPPGYKPPSGWPPPPPPPPPPLGWPPDLPWPPLDDGIPPTDPPRPPAHVPQTVIEDPPEPPESPETYPVPYPDRPLSAGVVTEDIAFDSMPSGWTQQVLGATLTVESGYLRSRKGVA